MNIHFEAYFVVGSNVCLLTRWWIALQKGTSVSIPRVGFGRCRIESFFFHFGTSGRFGASGGQIRRHGHVILGGVVARDGIRRTGRRVVDCKAGRELAHLGNHIG